MRSRSVLGQSRVLTITLVLAGCFGAYQTAPDDPFGAGGLRPIQEDKDAGRVGIAPGFNPKDYPVIGVERFSVAKSEIEDEGDQRFADKMAILYQFELVRRLRDTGLFSQVVNLSETDLPGDAGKALKLRGTITRLGRGSQAARYLVGFGAGSTRAQAEMHFVEAESGRVVLVTADRRMGSMGLFGGDSEDFLKESFDDMARDLAKFLVRYQGLAQSQIGATTGTPTVPATGAESNLGGPAPKSGAPAGSQTALVLSKPSVGPGGLKWPPVNSRAVMSVRTSGSFGSGWRLQTIYFLGERTWQGRMAFAFSDGSVTTYVDAQRRTLALVKYDAPVESFEPYLVLADWPLVVGKRWPNRYRYNDHTRGRSFDDVEYGGKVEAHEDVKTPAGTFKTFRIHLGGTSSNYILWYSDDLGIFVKTRNERFANHYLGSGVREAELAVYAER
jgi:hypothetical protein